MAIRDAEGHSLEGSPLDGVTVRRQVVETETYVETTRGVVKTREPNGALTVEPSPFVHERQLPRGQEFAPDGTIRGADGRAAFAPTDEQFARAHSLQRENAAEEAKQAELRTLGLTPTEAAQGFHMDGSLMRDRDGRIVNVCGYVVDTNREKFQRLGSGSTY